MMRFKSDGQGMLEYGLIITLVAAVAIVGVQLFGENVASGFSSIAGALPF